MSIHSSQHHPVRKLLFVVTEDWYFCSHRLSLAKSAVALGYKVYVATRVSECAEQIRQAGIEIIPLEMSRSGMNPLREFISVARLAQIYRRIKPQIIHHVALKPVVMGCLAALFCPSAATVNAVAGMGFIYSTRRKSTSLIRSVLRHILPALLNKRHSRVIVQNPSDGEILAEMGVRRSIIRLVHGAGVDTRSFSPQPEPLAPVTTILASRMIWDKGIRPFIAAARQIHTQRPDLQFALVGKPDPGNPTSVPEAQLRAWAKEGIVQWWGYQPDMAEIFGRSHIVCFPSTYGEGVPKVLIEAASCGKPIIATALPGCMEIVHHQENGYLIAPGDHDALVAAILALADNPAQRISMGNIGRALVQQRFSLDLVTQATLAVYEEVLAT